jgi:hypothetical protein
MEYSQTPRNLAAMLSRGPASFAATMLRALSPELGQTLRVYPWRPIDHSLVGPPAVDFPECL